MVSYNNYSVNGLIFDIPEGVTHFKFVPSNVNSVQVTKDVITFSYIKGTTSDAFEDFDGCTKLYDGVVFVPYLKPTKIEHKIISINKDNEFLCNCHENISITQFRYKDITEHHHRNKYYALTFLFSVDNPDFDSYYDIIEGTKLLSPIGDLLTELSQIKNNLVFNSGTSQIPSNRNYLPQSKYRNYRISSLDYIVDFFEKLEIIFDSYGFELVEFNKLKEVSKSVVTFKINSHSPEYIKRIKVRTSDHGIISSGAKVSFALMTPDTDIYEDFRIRYNNIDLIQNNREFKCIDKYGLPWRYNVVWQSELDEGFEHAFGSNDLGAFGYQFQFNAILSFYDVYDEHFSVIEEMLLDIGMEITKGVDFSIHPEISAYTVSNESSPNEG